MKTVNIHLKSGMTYCDVREPILDIDSGSFRPYQLLAPVCQHRTVFFDYRSDSGEWRIAYVRASEIAAVTTSQQ